MRRALIQFRNDFVNNAEEIFTGKDVVPSILTMLFGADGWDDLDGYIVDDVMQFKDTVNMLLKANLDPEDMKEILKSIYVNEDYISIGDLLSGVLDISLQDLDSVSGEAEIMMLKLLNAGVSAQQLIDVLSSPEAGTDDGLLNMLRELNAEAGGDEEGGQPGIVKYADDISKLYSEMEKTSKMAESIKAGESLSMSDILGLAEAHPELLAVINDTEALGTMLQDISAMDSQKINQLFQDWASGSEAVFKQYAQIKKIEEDFVTSGQSQTLQNYREWLSSIGDEQGAEAISTYLNLIAEGAIESAKAMLSFSDALDATANAISSNESKIKKAQEQLKSVQEGKGFDAQDMLTLAKDNENILRAIASGDTARLSSELNASVEQYKNAISQTWKDMFDQLRFKDREAQIKKLEGVSLDGIRSITGLKQALQDQGAAVPKWLEDDINLLDRMVDGALAAGEVVTNLKTIFDTSGEYAKAAQTERRFAGASDNNYLGALDILQGSVTAQGASGVLGVDSWKAALEDLEAGGVLKGMVSLFGDISKVAEECGYDIEAIVQRIEQLKQQAADMALSEMADQIRQQREADMAAQEEYATQIDRLMSAGSSGEAVTIWNGFDEAMQKSLSSTYPDLILALDEAAKAQKELNNEQGDSTEKQTKAAKAAEKLTKELNAIKKIQGAKYFKDTAKAVHDLGNGTISVSEAVDAFTKEEEKAVKANQEFLDVTKQMGEGAEVTASDVSTLADVLGWTPDAIINNWEQVGPLIESVNQAMQDARDQLQKEIFMSITGTSDADFSNVLNGLVAVQNTADAAVQALLGTGQFEIQSRELEEDVTYYRMNADGTLTPFTAHAGGTADFIVPTGGSVSDKRGSKKSGGGGGGGGKKNEDKGRTEVERMIDRMNQQNANMSHYRSLHSAQAGLFEDRGMLQGAMDSYAKEAQLIDKQNAELQKNISTIEQWMDKKRKELATLKEGTDEYKECANDLKLLQDTHKDYTLAVIDNTAAAEALRRKIKETKDEIRQMEIDLENLVLRAIQDREELQERMLQGTISMENQIMALIQKRYEKERDLILDNLDRQINALEKERDLLSEQLDLRRKQAQEEDKLTELAELEAKYVRISADPTRRKEAMEIEKQIKDLRDEIAWDNTEKEVEAQQKAIDERIEALENEKERTEKYYEEMFEHPTKLIAEMKEIMKGTDEEIIAWLKKNSEEYQNATANARKDMVNGWQKTLDDMRGFTKTYWEEVQSIIAKGDNAIISFLKKNSAEYKAASKQQAAAYVDEWKKQLEDLKKAHKQVTDQIAHTQYDVIEADAGTGSGSGSGSSGSGSGFGAIMYKCTCDGATIKSGSVSVKATRWSAIRFAPSISGYTASGASPTYVDVPSGGSVFVTYSYTKAKQATTNTPAKTSTSAATASVGTSKDVKTLMAYASGGIADYTGPAWVDGTKSRPERVLSPVQTELFDSLVRSLEELSRVRIPTMPYAYGSNALSGTGSVSVGDIIVNVDKLETDQDYEEMAEKVLAYMMDTLNRGAVVGGIRVTK